MKLVDMLILVAKFADFEQIIQAILGKVLIDSQVEAVKDARVPQEFA